MKRRELAQSQAQTHSRTRAHGAPVGGADAKKEEEVEEEEEEEDHFRDVPLVSLVRVLDKVGDHIKAAPLHGANLSAGACVWREGGGEYAMDADGLGFPLRVRAEATTRTYSRMLRRGWITPADTTRIGWPGVGGTGLVPRVTVWRRPARRRRGAVGLWKADSKAMLSLSSASLTRNGRVGREATPPRRLTTPTARP